MNFDYQKYILPRRRKLQAQGLTVMGQKRRRSASVPGLDGLVGNARMAAYMKLWRAGKIMKRGIERLDWK